MFSQPLISFAALAPPAVPHAMVHHDVAYFANAIATIYASYLRIVKERRVTNSFTNRYKTWTGSAI